MLFRTVLLIALLCAQWSSAVALERHYLASLDASSWVFVENSPTLCRISHQIPGFGTATFTREAGRGMQLELDSRYRFEKGINVELRSETHQWEQRQVKAVLARFETSGKRRLFVVPSEVAERSYHELSQGYQPGFLFFDDNPVLASLSNVRFGEVGSEFVQCVNRLYHHNFDDVRLSSIFFEPDNEFASIVQEDSAFVKMMQYLQVDDAVSEIVVTGYTDSSGLACYNDGLSERRAWYVYDLLVALGIDPKLLRVDYQGELQLAPGVSNKSKRKKSAQAANRRVTVELRR